MGSKKLNVLYILTDDQGAWAMHCAGCRELHTPNLDRLAREGMRFDSFYCASPVCSPARASLLTGTIPSAHGVHDWLRSGNVDSVRFAQQGRDNPYGNYADEREPIQYLKGRTCYTDVLREKGYELALSGKWHLGDSLTPQHGFSRWFTIGKGGCCYYHPDIVENGGITLRHGEYVTDLITGRALDFMEELARGEAPFYLAVHYTAPHSPWEAEHHPRHLIDLYEDCAFDDTPDVPDHPDLTVPAVYGTENRKINLRGYYAAITAMDEGVGRLLDRLDALGLSDDTLVIFNADNGMNMGHHGIWGKGNGTFPMNMFETSVKVPFIARCPGLIPAGRVCGEPVSAYDLFPTLIDALGFDSRAALELPGRSFLPLLKGEPAGEDREIVIFDEYGPVRMIRDSRYKYVHRYPYGAHELYDLTEDPSEEKNLIDDPAMAPVIIALRGRLQAWFARYADPLRDGLHENVTGLGQLCSAGAYAEKLDRYALPRKVTDAKQP